MDLSSLSELSGRDPRDFLKGLGKETRSAKARLLSDLCDRHVSFLQEFNSLCDAIVPDIIDRSGAYIFLEQLCAGRLAHPACQTEIMKRDGFAVMLLYLGDHSLDELKAAIISMGSYRELGNIVIQKLPDVADCFQHLKFGILLPGKLIEQAQFTEQISFPGCALVQKQIRHRRVGNDGMYKFFFHML